MWTVCVCVTGFVAAWVAGGVGEGGQRWVGWKKKVGARSYQTFPVQHCLLWEHTTRGNVARHSKTKFPQHFRNKYSSLARKKNTRISRPLHPSRKSLLTRTRMESHDVLRNHRSTTRSAGGPRGEPPLLSSTFQRSSRKEAQTTCATR